MLNFQKINNVIETATIMTDYEFAVYKKTKLPKFIMLFQNIIYGIYFIFFQRRK
jgi:hypothetical protein